MKLSVMAFYSPLFNLKIDDFTVSTWLSYFNSLSICTFIHKQVKLFNCFPLSSSFFILFNKKKSFDFHRFHEEGIAKADEIKFKLIDVLHDNAINEINSDVIVVICYSVHWIRISCLILMPFTRDDKIRKF